MDGRQKPADTAHLYLLAGTLCGLLSNASTDQARAAWAYAEVGDRDDLCAWARGMQALIEYWSERPRQAVSLAQAGQRYAESATAKARLFNIEARMWSRLGNLDDANRCVRAGDAIRSAVGTEAASR